MPLQKGRKKEAMAVVHANQILQEYERAAGLFKSFASAHEGVGVIREEYCEFEQAVFRNDLEQAREEARQLAAMGLRFLVDSEGWRDGTAKGTGSDD